MNVQIFIAGEQMGEIVPELIPAGVSTTSSTCSKVPLSGIGAIVPLIWIIEPPDAMQPWVCCGSATA